MQVAAYILIQVAPGKIWDVTETVSKLVGVKVAHAVTGLFDVIACVEVSHLRDLGGLVDRIQTIEGVQRTQTAVSLQAPNQASSSSGARVQE